MGTPSSSIRRKSVSKSVHQQSTSATPARRNSATSMRTEVQLQHIDTTVLDSSEQSGPPPAYGEAPCESPSEKHGLSTDDGPIDIQINQLDHHSSHTSIPALYEQQSAQDEETQPPPYMPSLPSSEQDAHSLRSTASARQIASPQSENGSLMTPARSTEHASQLQLSLYKSRSEQHHDRVLSTPVRDHDTLRQQSHSAKRIGGMVTALAKGPVDVSVALTRGCHNLPKLWGDDTVRPHEQVSDLRSGMRAAGKEFGLGWYDGITGIVTQPWNGAMKEGAGGFVKGFGKGLGGLAVKPTAAVCGALGYSMKGVHKEMQKLSSSNAHGYTTASGPAQAYEEWLQSTTEEQQDIIGRWGLSRKHLRKRVDSHEMQDAQRVQQRAIAGYYASGGDIEYGTTNSLPKATDTAAEEDLAAAMLDNKCSRSSLRSAFLQPRASFESTKTLEDSLYRDGSESARSVADAEKIRRLQEMIVRLQRQQQPGSDPLKH